MKNLLLALSWVVSGSVFAGEAARDEGIVMVCYGVQTHRSHPAGDIVVRWKETLPPGDENDAVFEKTVPGLPYREIPVQVRSYWKETIADADSRIRYVVEHDMMNVGQIGVDYDRVSYVVYDPSPWSLNYLIAAYRGDEQIAGRITYNNQPSSGGNRVCRLSP